MSLDELTTESAPAQQPRAVNWVVLGVIWACSVLMACLGVWAVMNNNLLQASWAQDDAAQASHDALVESLDVMAPLWEQLDLPVDERSQVAIESGARIGRPGSPVEVSSQLRVNEPQQIGIVTTARSEGITSLLVTIVRYDAGGTPSGSAAVCEVGVDYDGQSCEQIVEESLRTFTAPGG